MSFLHVYQKIKYLSLAKTMEKMKWNYLPGKGH